MVKEMEAAHMVDRVTRVMASQVCVKAILSLACGVVVFALHFFHLFLFTENYSQSSQGYAGYGQQQQSYEGYGQQGSDSSSG